MENVNFEIGDTYGFYFTLEKIVAKDFVKSYSIKYMIKDVNSTRSFPIYNVRMVLIEKIQRIWN